MSIQPSALLNQSALTSPLTETARSSTARKNTPETAELAVQPTLEQFQAALNQVSDAVLVKTNDLRFTIDNETGKALVRITDRQTGEMIRQIPSVELVEIAKSLDRLQGLLFKQLA